MYSIVSHMRFAATASRHIRSEGASTGREMLLRTQVISDHVQWMRLSVSRLDALQHTTLVSYDPRAFTAKNWRRQPTCIMQ